MEEVYAGLFLVLICITICCLWLRTCFKCEELREESDRLEQLNAAMSASFKRGLEISDQLDALATRIGGFRDLGHGWDTYDAIPISEHAICLAYVVCALPSVVPTSNGGVQFEWHRMGWDVEVEIHADGHISGIAEMTNRPSTAKEAR